MTEEIKTSFELNISGNKKEKRNKITEYLNTGSRKSAGGIFDSVRMSDIMIEDNTLFCEYEVIGNDIFSNTQLPIFEIEYFETKKSSCTHTFAVVPFPINPEEDTGVASEKIWDFAAAYPPRFDARRHDPQGPWLFVDVENI